MNDERFEQDLRAVLLEDAPRDVPDSLRRRVAAVADSPRVVVGPARPVWRHPVPIWLGAAVVFVAVVAFAAWRLGPVSQPGFGGPGAATPSNQPSLPASIAVVPSPSPSVGESAPPSPTPAPSRGIGACVGANIEGTILDWQGAAGSRIADVQFTNTSAHPCFLRGTPGLQLVDADGRVLIDSAAAGSSGRPHVTATDATFELAPGGHLKTEVQAANYCGAAPKLPIDIGFALPADGGSFVARPGAGVSSDDAVPPCLGSAASEITMNGWQR